MNFVAMMTTVLVTNQYHFSIHANLDMKFMKEENKSRFKILYGNFSLENYPENKLDSVVISPIQKVVKNYNLSVNYFEILSSTSIELSLVLVMIHQYVLNKERTFHMSIKNGGIHPEIVFLMDEYVSEILESFIERGAMVGQDTMENTIVRVSNTTMGEQLVTLNATLENLNQRKLDEKHDRLETQHKKKLVYPNSYKNNQATNIHYTLVILIVMLAIGNFLLFS